jgi:hypothetical protein
MQRGLSIQVAMAEGASAIDAVSTQVVFAGSIAEFVSAVATQSVVKTVNANVTGIQLLVSIGDVLVWAVIDDSQNPNWQNINSAQNPGWNNLPS